MYTFSLYIYSIWSLATVFEGRGQIRMHSAVKQTVSKVIYFEFH